jgi:hypothetical protein
LVCEGCSEQTNNTIGLQSLSEQTNNTIGLQSLSEQTNNTIGLQSLRGADQQHDWFARLVRSRPTTRLVCKA